MATINYAAREISVKVVYYGPGLSGKTTNLQVIHKKSPPENRSDMVSLATETDRTLFFDFLPLDLGKIRGFSTKFQLYTVPGQVYYNATRKLVLRGVDGIVFVADSAPDKMPENIESFRNMEENLAEYGYKRESIPIIIQYNKRDLPDALPVEVLNAQMNKYSSPWTEGIAYKGVGVFETLKLIGKYVMDELNRKYAGSMARSSAPAAPAPNPESNRPTQAIPVIPPPVQQTFVPPIPTPAAYQQQAFAPPPAPPPPSRNTMDFLSMSPPPAPVVPQAQSASELELEMQRYQQSFAPPPAPPVVAVPPPAPADSFGLSGYSFPSSPAPELAVQQPNGSSELQFTSALNMNAPASPVFEPPPVQSFAPPPTPAYSYQPPQQQGGFQGAFPPPQQQAQGFGYQPQQVPQPQNFGYQQQAAAEPSYADQREWAEQQESPSGDAGPMYFTTVDPGRSKKSKKLPENPKLKPKKGFMDRFFNQGQ